MKYILALTLLVGCSTQPKIASKPALRPEYAFKANDPNFCYECNRHLWLNPNQEWGEKYTGGITMTRCETQIVGVSCRPVTGPVTGPVATPIQETKPETKPTQIVSPLPVKRRASRFNRM